MALNLFGVRYRRSPDIEWYPNPHTAVERARELKCRKILWLVYNPQFPHPYHRDSTAWQTEYLLSDFINRHLPGFAAADSKAWQNPSL